MLAIRIYLSVLTLLFLFSAAVSRGVGAFEAVIVVCALIYLILDTREHLQAAKADLRALEQLEKKLSVLLH